MATLKNTTLSDTGFIRLPAGTTGQRPGSPTVGMSRFNTETKQLEYYDGYAWLNIYEKSGYITSASGGTTTTDGNFRIHTFTSSGTFTVSTIVGAPTVEYLIVAGGGGGHNNAGGGGGAGGLLTGTISVTTGSYTITVGAGASGASYPATNGSNSEAFGFIAIGGGGGGPGTGDAWYGQTGGSGGGGASITSMGDITLAAAIGQNGTNGQGTPGGHGMLFSDPTFRGGGGGGGALRPGNPAPTGSGPVFGGGRGGNGFTSTITGSAVTYGGGGGGGSGTYSPVVFNEGGAGGGGRGGWAGASAVAGTANTGGGGGGGYNGTGAGAAGGSGVVIVRYRFQ
jgi:hypothetical protein